MNTRNKGRLVEKQAINILERWGYRCIIAPNTARMIITKDRKKLFVSQDNDFFGLFDIEAKNGNITRYIQVKSNPSHVSEIKPKLEEFYRDVSVCTDSIEIWLKIPFKGFKIYIYKNNEWLKVDIDLYGEKK